MANDLKKVGLVFNADGTTDFVKSLKSVNAEIRENYANFKLVQSQYDENTKSSQKLKDKLEYLNSAYDSQQKKVLVLRSELEELKNSENSNEDAISKKQIALKNAETQMNKYANQIKDVNNELKTGNVDLKEFADNLNKTGSKITDAGKKMSVVSGAIVGVGVAAKTSFDAVDEGADNVIKASGAVGNQAAALEESYIKCAEINNTDVTTAVQLVSRAMGDASIDSSEYGTVLDALSSAAQASGISIDKLTENITKYGAPMRALGYDTSESIAIFAAWEKAGVNTEIAFSGMKKAISNFSAEGKNAKEEFSKTLEEIKKCPDIASATTKAIEVFGAKAGPDLADAIQNGRFEFEDMLKVIEGSKGTVDNTFDGLLDGSYDADLAMQNTKIALSEVGDTIMESLSPMLQEASKGLQKFSDWFKNLDDNTKNTILKIGLFAAAIGPLLMVFGTMANGISSIIKLFTQLSPIFKLVKVGITGISTAMSFLAANPIVLIIAAIAALVAGFVLLWNKCEGFRNFWIGLWKGFTNICQSAIDSVVGFFNNCIDFIQNNWQEILGFIINPFAGAFNLLYEHCEIFRNFIDGIWTFITSIFTAFDDYLTNIFTTDWTERFGIFGNVLNAFFTNLSNIWNSIKLIFQGIIDFVKGVFTGNWEMAWNGIKNIFKGVFDGLLAVAKTPINGIIGLMNGLIDGINLVIKGINKIKFDVPDWVPGIGGKKFGFNIDTIDKISYLADGGTLLNGAAVVAEAGPELLLQRGNKTRVLPLNNNSEINDLDEFGKQEININTTINNNSKWISPSENAKQVRKELQWYLLTKKGRRS